LAKIFTGKVNEFNWFIEKLILENLVLDSNNEDDRKNKIINNIKDLLGNNSFYLLEFLYNKLQNSINGPNIEKLINYFINILSFPSNFDNIVNFNCEKALYLAYLIVYFVAKSQLDEDLLLSLFDFLIKISQKAFLKK
jgi:hypothetical protein